MLKIKNDNLKYHFVLASVLIISINALYLKLTLDNNWASDDYPYIFGIKIFNLINEQSFFLFQSDPDRFRPVYWFIIQFIPENYQLWHSIVVMFYAITSIFTFLVVYKITSNSTVSFISSILFSINYSLSAKALNWGIFFGPILNLFFGYVNILIFLSLIKNKNNFILKSAILILVNFFNSMITEGALIYPFLNFIIFFFWKKNQIKREIILLLPVLLSIIVYFIASILLTGNLNSTLSDRLKTERSEKYEKIFVKSDKDELYFYRSNYAPRNIKGYSLRLIDNMAGSVNLLSLEDSIKSSIHNQKFIIFLKKNYFFFIIFFLVICFFLIAKLANIFAKKLKNADLKEYYLYSLLYLSTLLLYNFIFFRKDINLALAFASSLLISKVLKDLFYYKNFFLIFLILSIYVFPTVVYLYSGVKRYGDFYTDNNVLNYQNYLKNLNTDQTFLLKDDKDYRYFYYFKNFNYNSENLKKYKSNNLFNFYNNFSKEEFIKPSS